MLVRNSARLEFTLTTCFWNRHNCSKLKRISNH